MFIENPNGNEIVNLFAITNLYKFSDKIITLLFSLDNELTTDFIFDSELERDRAYGTIKKQLDNAGKLIKL